MEMCGYKLKPCPRHFECYRDLSPTLGMLRLQQVENRENQKQLWHGDHGDVAIPNALEVSKSWYANAEM